MTEKTSNTYINFATYTCPIMENIHIVEAIIMTVEKFIRILGYIVYLALWLPVVVLIVAALPIWIAIKTRSLSLTWWLYKDALKTGFKHDMTFINTGVWY